MDIKKDPISRPVKPCLAFLASFERFVSPLFKKTKIPRINVGKVDLSTF